MKHQPFFTCLSLCSIAPLLVAMPALAETAWVIDTKEDWKSKILVGEGMVMEDGFASPKGDAGSLKSNIHRFDSKTSAKSLAITQSPIWQNWNPIENLGPSNLADAPVMLTMGPDNYWMFGGYGGGKPKRKKANPPNPRKPSQPKTPASKASISR